MFLMKAAELDFMIQPDEVSKIRCEVRSDEPGFWKESVKLVLTAIAWRNCRIFLLFGRLKQITAFLLPTNYGTL